MDQIIEDSKIKSLALMLQDGISEEKACEYLQIPLERQGEMLPVAYAEATKNAASPTASAWVSA